MNWKKLAWPTALLSLVGVIVAFAISLKSAQGENFTAGVGIDQKLGANVALDAKFKDELGDDVTVKDYFKNGKPVILSFVFYRCEGTCALELSGITKLIRDMKLQQVGEDYELLTVSIHPKETPDLAAAKKRSFLTMVKSPKAEQGWHFLTGTYEEAKKLADSVGYRYVYEEEKDRVVHPTGIMFLTPGGRVSRYLYGVEYPAKIASNAVGDATEGTIGTTANVLDFACFQRDAQTGSVRLNVMNATKVVGIATVLALLISIVFMSRKNPAQGGGA